MNAATDIRSALALSIKTRAIVRVHAEDPAAAVDVIRGQPNAIIWEDRLSEIAGGSVHDVFGSLAAGPFRLLIVRAKAG